MNMRQYFLTHPNRRCPSEATRQRPSLRPGRSALQAGRFLFCAFAFLVVGSLAAQGQAPAGQPKKIVYPATIVVSCDLPCRWTLDGKSHGAIDEGRTASAGVQLGEHQVEAETLDGLDQVQKQANVTEKGETSLKFELESLRDTRVNLEQQANAARPAEQAYEDGEMLAAQREYDRALPLLVEACNAGSANGCASLGYMYDAPQGVAQDYKKASVFYEKACSLGVAASCTSLGILYEYGHGVTQDYGQARANYQKGCDGGYPSGCSYLGDLYRTGHGVPKDIARGRELLQKGCDLGDQWGCDELKKDKP
jgi:TPR repeat protein